MKRFFTIEGDRGFMGLQDPEASNITTICLFGSQGLAEAQIRNEFSGLVVTGPSTIGEIQEKFPSCKFGRLYGDGLPDHRSLDWFAKAA